LSSPRRTITEGRPVKMLQRIESQSQEKEIETEMEKKYKVEHIGFVARDVERTAEMLSNYLGIKDWRILTIEPPVLYDATFHEKKISHSFKVAVAHLNDINIEILMPIKGESVYTEFLREKGEGFHHICYLFSSEVELEEMKEELENKGGKVIQSGKIKGRGFYYYIEKERIVLELLFRKQ